MERMDAMRIGVGIKKFLVISIRIFYISVFKHPFLVGFVCLMLFLYKSFPFLFSLLVHASPILICTAILLGTLLILGEPSLPEIGKEKEEEVTPELSSLKAGFLGDVSVLVKKNENFFVERFAVKREGKAEEAIEGENWKKNGIGKFKGDDDLDGCVPLVDENSREIQFEKQVSEVGGDESLQIEDDKIPRDSIEPEHDDYLNTERPSWKWANDNEVEENGDEDEDFSDSGTDGAESASLDASIGDIIPMLDELHPLIDVEAPQTAHMSSDRSDASSVESHDNESSIESHEDIKSQTDGEGDDDDDNDNDEEEEALGGIEDESKSAIKWTEDDQKNLVDLGTSEHERNLRLESLMAKIRTCRSMKVAAEKNLIDLDANDLPCNNLPAISTTRRNPFDLPYDSFDEVPGSAPSILLPRHNPFDFSYDLGEEKSDLKGDNLQEDFSPFQHREPIFRRYESFNLGTSFLGATKHARQDRLWTPPYFVPEQFVTEETSHRAFVGQSSEASDSKLSSIPDTESVSSAADEEKKLNEDGSQETEIISSLDHAYVLIQHGSLSSEDVDSLDNENVERRDAHVDGFENTLGNVVNHHELGSRLSASGRATPEELNTSEILLRMEPGAEDYNSRSSLSSFSEVDDVENDGRYKESVSEPTSEHVGDSNISMPASLGPDSNFVTGMVNNDGKESALEPSISHMNNSGILAQTSTNSDFYFSSGAMDDNQHEEPVYDASPRAVEKLLSFSSISSDAQGEKSEMDSPPSLANFAGEEIKPHNASTERDASSCQELLEGSLKEPLVDKNQSILGDVAASKHDVKEAGMRVDDQASNSQNGSNVESSLNVQETSITPAEFIKKVETENIVHLPQVLDRETSGSAPVQQETAIEVDSRDNILDKIVYEDSAHVSEGTSYSGEAARWSSVFKEKSNEDEEVDEGLSSKLDTAGNFRVKEVASKSLHDGEMQNHDNNLSSSNSNMAEFGSELPILGVKSVTDFDLAFEQISRVDVEEVTLPSTLVVANESRDSQQSSSDLQVEISSLDELHYAMKQVQVREIGEPEESCDPIKETVSRTSEVDQISPAKEVEPRTDASIVQKGGLDTNDSGSQELGAKAPKSPKDGVDRTSGISSLSITDAKNENEN